MLAGMIGNSLRAAVSALAAAVLPAGIAAAEGAVPVAYFTDNGDRAALAELRARDPASLSDSERAVLTAANRLGWVRVEGCNRDSNAILIRLDGRDAILTSRHLVAGSWAGQGYCADDARVWFHPNAAYWVPGGAEAAGIADYDARVAAEPGPVNAAGGGLFMGPASDWLVYFLAAPVSDRPMPAGSWGEGHPRGAIAFSGGGQRDGAAVVIGFDGRFFHENGWQFSYQPCRYLQERAPWAPVYVGCDVSPGASSSFVGIMEGGELRLLAMISRSSEPMVGTNVPLPWLPSLWNQAVPARVIRDALEPPAEDGGGSVWPFGLGVTP